MNSLWMPVCIHDSIRVYVHTDSYVHGLCICIYILLQILVETCFNRMIQRYSAMCYCYNYVYKLKREAMFSMFILRLISELTLQISDVSICSAILVTIVATDVQT